MNVGYPKLEYKYLIPLVRLDEIRREMLPHLRPDPYTLTEGRGLYTVRSVYLDTRDLATYREKIEGEKHRKKYRVRTYNDRTGNDIAFLEIKKKDNKFISKFRAILQADHIHDFLHTRDFDRFIVRKSGDGIDDKNAQRFLYHYDTRGLRPVILVVYEREAYTGIGNDNFRITIDRNLRSTMVTSFEDIFLEDKLTPAMRRHCILEVKFVGGVPGWLRGIIQRYGLKRRALSKYTICLDSQRNDNALQMHTKRAGHNPMRVPNIR